MAVDVSRRDVFGKVVTWALGLVAAGFGLVPALRSVVGTASLDTVRGPEGFLPLAPLAELSPEPREIELSGEVRDAWLRQTQDVGAVWALRDGDRPRVFSSICPHLGCAVDYDAEARRFLCPCHGSAFGLDGRVLAGPSPRSLDPLPVRVETDGRVSCRYLRFAPGVAVRRVL